MGEFLFGLVIIAGALGACIFVSSKHVKDKYTATIDDHVEDLAQARIRLIPQSLLSRQDALKGIAHVHFQVALEMACS